MAVIFILRIFILVALVCTSVTSRSMFERRYLLPESLNRLHREVGAVSITMESKIQCDQGRMVSVTQMKGKIYLGCAYFHPTEYYEVGVIQVYDAVSLKPAAAPIELELPQDEMLDKLVSSPTNSVIYMITFSYGQPQKSIWTLSFPDDTGLEVNFFLMRPATLIGLKVSSDGKIVLNEADMISVYGADGKVISETVNPVHEQGQNTIEVLLLDSGNFLLTHVIGDNINQCDITEITPAGKIVKSYSTSSGKDAVKLGFTSVLEPLDAGRLLLLNWNNEPGQPLEDSIIVIRTDLSDGRKVISGSGNGIEEFGQYFSYSPSNRRLLVGFPYQAVVHAFKVSA